MAELALMSNLFTHNSELQFYFSDILYVDRESIGKMSRKCFSYSQVKDDRELWLVKVNLSLIYSLCICVQRREMEEEKGVSGEGFAIHSEVPFHWTQ